MKKYYGNYLGLVIDDEDPDYRNRIKVFIPAISATLLKKLNSKKEETPFKDKFITGVGYTLKNFLPDDALQDLKRILPWAECAAPLFGGSTSLHYNPVSKKATNRNNTGIAEKGDNDFPQTTPPATSPIHPDKTAADESGVTIPGTQADSFFGGMSPSEYPLPEIARDKKVIDLAAEGEPTDRQDLKDTSNDATNPLPDKYNENTYDLNGTYSSMIPGGMFSTPKVNSHVWVFFNEGDVNYPVYFAQHTVISDWQRLKQVTGEKLAKPDFTTETKQLTGNSAKENYSTENYKNIISTIAQPGAGVVEFMTQQQSDEDSKVMDDNSGLKISSASGGMYSFMMRGNTEYAPVNKTTKVAGDYFLTIEGFRETDIKSSSTTIIAEDETTIVGNVSDESIEATKNIKNILKKGHDIAIEESQLPASEVDCPICNAATISDSGGLAEMLMFRLSIAPLNIPGRDSIGHRAEKEQRKPMISTLQNTTNKEVRNDAPTCGNPGCINNKIPDYTANNYNIEKNNTDYQASVYGDLLANEEKLGIGGNQTTIVTKNSVYKVGLIFNDLQPYAKLANSYPIKNGIEFVNKKGIAPYGDSVDTYKVMDVPSAPAGNYDVIVGSKYSLKVGARGIHIHTIGNIEINGGHFELTSNYISLGNKNSLTKINGSTVIIEAEKSITIGGAPTNVHVNGSLHATGNVTTKGSIYADGNLYAKKLIMPYSIQRTDLSSASPDYTTALSVWQGEAKQAFEDSVNTKKLKHYDNYLHGKYPSTGSGIMDIALDWLTKAQLDLPYDNWQRPTGIAICPCGIGDVYNFPHIHDLHNMSHEHSYRGPEGFYVNHPDEMYEVAALAGKAIPDNIY